MATTGSTQHVSVQSRGTRERGWQVYYPYRETDKPAFLTINSSRCFEKETKEKYDDPGELHQVL